MQLDNRRTRRRASVEGQIRTVRALHREEWDLRVATRKGKAVIPLDEPVRWGWMRYFFIRPDLEHSPEGPLLREVLALVQNVQVSNRRDFAARDWKQGGKKRPQPHELQEISERTFWGLEERLQRLFTVVVHRDRGRVTHRTFAFNKPWKFVSRTRTHFMTHREVPNSEAESQLRHVESRLYGKGWPFRHIIRHFGAWRFGCHWSRWDLSEGAETFCWEEEI